MGFFWDFRIFRIFLVWDLGICGLWGFAVLEIAFWFRDVCLEKGSCLFLLLYDWFDKFTLLDLAWFRLVGCALLKSRLTLRTFQTFSRPSAFLHLFCIETGFPKKTHAMKLSKLLAPPAHDPCGCRVDEAS